MGSTTDFDDWLAAEDVEEHEEIYALYQAVSGREDFGNYTINVKGDQTFVKGHTGTTLFLGSEKARRAFLNAVHALTGDSEMDMDSWIGYQRNMANPKA